MRLKWFYEKKTQPHKQYLTTFSVNKYQVLSRAGVAPWETAFALPVVFKQDTDCSIQFKSQSWGTWEASHVRDDGAQGDLDPLLLACSPPTHKQPSLSYLQWLKQVTYVINPSPSPSCLQDGKCICPTRWIGTKVESLSTGFLVASLPHDRVLIPTHQSDTKKSTEI